MVEEKTIQKENTNESTEKVRNLILFNDDFNTFEFVIETLIDVCKHEPEQAEQCTIIVHFKGKCAVKSGSFTVLKPIFTEMSNRNLTVEIN
ncbi:MAG: ATP-dependent Clp protease adaptor ClpS [Bacteroidota bacterium]